MNKINNLFSIFILFNTNRTMVSSALTYFFHVGVLKILQKGIFNSRTPTFLKNIVTAFINSCVSTLALFSKQPKRTSNATRAIAVN